MDGRSEWRIRTMLLLTLVSLLTTGVRSYDHQNRTDSPIDGHNLMSAGDLLTGFAPATNSKRVMCIDNTYEAWDHPFLGSFPKDRSFCAAECSRASHCCRPQVPDDISVRFNLTKPSSENSAHVFDDENLGNYLDESKRPVVFITTGIQTDPKSLPQQQEIQKAYADKGFNAVLVDWTGHGSMSQAIQDLRVVGAMIGSIISGFDLEKQAVCMGFGLGAHVCGEAGRYVQKDGKSIAKCHMLDPVSAYFDGCDNSVRQNRHDCHTVVTLHSSQVLSAVSSTPFGTGSATGHCDFWFNSAHPNKQTNCGVNVRVPFSFESKSRTEDLHWSHIISCAHHRVLDYYLAQLRGDCSYTGKEASECGESRDCDVLRSGKTMTVPPFDSCRHNQSISFLVEVPVSGKNNIFCA